MFSWLSLPPHAQDWKTHSTPRQTLQRTLSVSSRSLAGHGTHPGACCGKGERQRLLQVCAQVRLHHAGGLQLPRCERSLGEDVVEQDADDLHGHHMGQREISRLGPLAGSSHCAARLSEAKLPWRDVSSAGSDCAVEVSDGNADGHITSGITITDNVNAANAVPWRQVSALLPSG